MYQFGTIILSFLSNIETQVGALFLYFLYLQKGPELSDDIRPCVALNLHISDGPFFFLKIINQYF